MPPNACLRAGSLPKSPRMVPGRASSFRVGPIRVRIPWMTFSPSTTMASTGPLVIYSTVGGKNGLSTICA